MSKLTFVFFATCLISFSSLAGINQAPPKFAYKDGQAIFVDFKSATYIIKYDFSAKTVEVESTISFYASGAGYPIFDLVTEPKNITLDDQAVTSVLTPDPDAQTSYRVVNAKITKGLHILKLNNSITVNVVFNELGVGSAFWLGDLSDRNYLEKYIPSNMEYDQFAKKFIVNFLNFGDLKQVVKTNGVVKNLKNLDVEITFPDFYTSSSVFFHTFPQGLNLPNVQFTYQSIDGRILPIDIYTSVEIAEFIPLTKSLLAELEADYGPFPHDKVLIYGNSLAKGGMEYSGATATGLQSLGHELFHSYNARGVMPANGNSGWMDEAMSRWRDNGYPLAKELTFESTQLAAHSVWQRNTDRMAYTEGSAFLSLLAYKMNEKGVSLKEILNDYFKTYMYKTVTTKMLEKNLIEASGLDFTAEFNKYIYNKSSVTKRMVEEDPHHPELSKEELLKLTMPAKQ